MVPHSDDSGSDNQKEASKQSKYFHIKTIRVYDTQNHFITDILLEHVEGDFGKFRIYDASFLQLNENIYYYKRLRDMDKKPKLVLFKYNLITFKES